MLWTVKILAIYLLKKLKWVAEPPTSIYFAEKIPSHHKCQSKTIQNGHKVLTYISHIPIYFLSKEEWKALIYPK